MDRVSPGIRLETVSQWFFCEICELRPLHDESIFIAHARYRSRLNICQSGWQRGLEAPSRKLAEDVEIRRPLSTNSVSNVDVNRQYRVSSHVNWGIATGSLFS